MRHGELQTLVFDAIGSPICSYLEDFPSDKSCRIEAPSDGIIGRNSCGIPPDTVSLSCSMQFRGNIVPMMQWRELDGNVVTEGIYNMVINSNTVSTLVLNGNQMQNRKYMSNIVYTNPTLRSNYSWIATAKMLRKSYEIILTLNT